MKLNEKIGLPCLILSLVSLTMVIITGNLYFFIGQVVFGILSTIFLSWWGITTFNDKFINLTN